MAQQIDLGRLKIAADEIVAAGALALQPGELNRRALAVGEQLVLNAKGRSPAAQDFALILNCHIIAAVASAYLSCAKAEG